jgi:hypothetical protein
MDLRTPAIRDQMLAAQICALCGAASQRLDERLLLESVASPGEWHRQGAAPDHFLTHLAIWEGPGEGQCPETEWGDLVTDAEYHTQPAPGRVGASIRLAVMAGYSA